MSLEEKIDAAFAAAAWLKAARAYDDAATDQAAMDMRTACDESTAAVLIHVRDAILTEDGFISEATAATLREIAAQ